MKQGVGRGAPASLPALPAPPVWQGDTLQAAATCGRGDGNPGFGDGRQRARGRPGERLSAFQTCPWKRSGPSRLRCKWPQTKSWGVSTPKPRRMGSPAARCLQGTETPDPAALPAGGCRQGGLWTVHTEPPLHPVAEGSPPPGCPPRASPACAVCLSLPRCWLGWCRSGGPAALPSVPLPAPLPVPSPCPFAGTQLRGEPVWGVQAAPG